MTLRQEARRLARKTLGFSENRRPLQQALGFIDAYDNYVRPHEALRIAMPEGASPRRWRHRTPTMAAGITDHPRMLKELLWHT